MKSTKIILIIGTIGLIILVPLVFLMILIAVVVYLIAKKYFKNSKKHSRNVMMDVTKYTFGQKPRKLMLLGEVDGVEVFKVDNVPSFIFRKGISVKCLTGVKIDGKALGIRKINEMLQWFSEKSLAGYPVTLIVTHNMEVQIIAEANRSGLRLTQEMLNELIMESSTTLRNAVELFPFVNETNAIKVLETPLYDFGGA